MSQISESQKTTLVIAVPVAGGQVSTHFGHCPEIAVFDVDPASRQVLNSRMLTPPPHEPGVLPRWLHTQGVGLVIAGGMGQRAQNLFADHQIDVLVGAPPDAPLEVVQTYLRGELSLAENTCDH
jgi:ATP-binding protein involved in chromosome partitioning